MKPLYFNSDDMKHVGPLFYSAGHYYAVCEFLQAVERLGHECDVLKDLDNISLLYTPDIERTLDEYEMADAEHEINDDWKVLCKLKRADCVRLSSDIRLWAEKYHLDQSVNDLYLQIALAEIRRIYHARNHPMAYRLPDETVSLTRVLFLDGVDTMRMSDGVNGPNALRFTQPFMFIPSDAVWDKRDQTWEEFDAEITEAFNAYKAAYKIRMDKYFEQNGYRDKPVTEEKRNLDHFMWLAMYRVLGCSHKDIADKYYTTARNVGQRISETENLVLLTKRPPNKPGRPPKQNK